MIAGTILNLISFDGSVIQRCLVSVENGLYFVCKEEEFEESRRENREPVCIGFRPEFVVGVVGS